MTGRLDRATCACHFFCLFLLGHRKQKGVGQGEFKMASYGGLWVGELEEVQGS